MRTYITLLGLSALLSSVSSCRDGVDPLPEDVGHVEFRMSGALTQHFSVTAPAKLEGRDWNSVAYAELFRLQSGAPLRWVEARHRISDSKMDRIFVYFPLPEVATYAVPAGPQQVVREVWVSLGEDYPYGGSAEATFRMDSGTIQLTRAVPGRVRGTFGGRARKINPANRELIQPAATVDIRSGAFDVPIVSGP
jgi:hypothetical protein